MVNLHKLPLHLLRLVEQLLFLLLGSLCFGLFRHYCSKEGFWTEEAVVFSAQDLGQCLDCLLRLFLSFLKVLGATALLGHVVVARHLPNDLGSLHTVHSSSSSKKTVQP